MALVRWRPMREWLNVRGDMDRLFSDFFGGSMERSPFEGNWSPSVDIKETDEAIQVAVELPGLDKDDVNISLKDNVLSIRGNKKQEREVKNEQYHRVERSYGSFERSFTLSSSVDESKIKANFKNGVLNIYLPKVPEAKGKAIPISVD